MTRIAGAALAITLLVLPATPARGCDPYWDWCGWESYDPYWDLPAYEEPWGWDTWWDEPVYVPAYEEPVFYDLPLYVAEPAPIPEPVLVPEPAYAPEPVPVPEAVQAPPQVYVPEPVQQPEPAYVLPVSEPQVTWSDPYVWSAPGTDVIDATLPPVPQPAASVAVAPDPDALRALYGLHDVSDVFAEHTVTIEGPLTTFASSTVAMRSGTAARLVASIGTGEASAYDGLLWNTRMSLSDGRAVQGEVYANYAWNGWDWLFDKYVFFQDDRELARLAEIVPTPAGVSPIPPTTVVVSAPPPSTGPAAPMPTTADARPGAPSAGDPPSAPAATPAPGSASPTSPTASLVRAGVALAPQADVLPRIEVLRGKRVLLWLRATIDGITASVVDWDLLSGELTALGPIAGSGDEPLAATWRSVTPSGEMLLLRFRVTVAVPREGLRETDATIEVVVRSPALVQ